MKYDAIIGYWQTRVLQGVSKAQLEDYCQRLNLVIVTDRAIGLTYREVTLKKA